MLLLACTIILFGDVFGEIEESPTLNKLFKVKPVGRDIGNRFLPLTELPPPHHPTRGIHYHGGRRHLDPDCGVTEGHRVMYDGAKVNIQGDYYDEKQAKTLATVIFPDHIDHKHFQITSSMPYMTVGRIEGIGYHPTTNNPSECEKIYQDHLEENDSGDDLDYSEESIEMARMPVISNVPSISEESKLNLYSNLE